MSERHNQGKNCSGKIRIKLFAKSFILQVYDVLARHKMAECDRQLQQYLQQREDRSHGAPLPEENRKGRRKKKRANKPQFDLREGMFRMTGTDLTRIDGIDGITASTVISEAGYDMGKWKTENHFVSWMRLCPDNRTSG